jgi:hypothetical protein
MPLVHLCNIYAEVDLEGQFLIEQLMIKYTRVAFEKNRLNIILNPKKALPIILNQYANLYGLEKGFEML